MRKPSARPKPADSPLEIVPALDAASAADESPNALMMGLDILEYIASSPKDTTQSAIVQALDIPYTNFYRAAAVLEEKGYLTRAGRHGAYQLTGKLRRFQSTAPAHQHLLTSAGPIVEALSEQVVQSCNLSIPAGRHMLVVLEQQANCPYSVSVPVGFGHPISDSAPGVAFAAFDPSSRQAGDVDADTTDLGVELKAAVAKAREAGFAQTVNRYLPDVVDLSCPVFAGTDFVAALTMHYLKSVGGMNLAWCLAALQEAAERLTNALPGRSCAA
jgi:DNA-binding IclR family transcriptional regulator